MAIDAVASAFSYAPPYKEHLSATPENFLTMQSAFAVVWCPVSVAFHCSEWVEDDLIRAVQMSDAKSSILRVLYRLERPPDREWRIAACRAHRSAGRRV